MHTETIKVPMMNGDRVEHEVLAFECEGFRFGVRRVSERMCFILHRATGLKVTAEHTGDMREAAEGFCDAVRVGGYNLAGLEAAAATAPQINADCEAAA